MKRELPADSAPLLPDVFDVLVDALASALPELGRDRPSTDEEGPNAELFMGKEEVMASVSDPEVVLGAIENAQRFVRTGWVDLEDQPVWRVYRYWNTEFNGQQYALIWTPDQNVALKRSEFVSRVALIFECKQAQRCAFCQNYLKPPEPKGDEPSSSHREPTRCTCNFDEPSYGDLEDLL